MLSRSPLALLLALPVATFCAEPADTVNRTPPAVYAEHIAPLLTRPDSVATARAALASDEQDGLVLLTETVHYRDTDGTLYRAYHHVYHVLGQSAVEGLANSIFTYDRERESLFLIEAATILADGTRLLVEAKGAFIQTPQHEAENSLYTSEAELNLIFPQVAPGATTEAIVLVRENTPLMPGEFCANQTFASGWPIHRRNFVVELPDSDWARLRTLATGSAIPEPRVETPASGRTRRTWTQPLAPRSHWEESAPAFRYCQPTLWLTTLPDWERVAGWFYGLASARSDLGDELTAEVDRLTAGLTEPAQIVDTLQTAVSGEVRYTGLEFGLAGYQPYPCAEVWHRRYGDCKDKANLLRAMLAHKGIRAHLVLLNTWPLGRVEKESPTWMQFNHVIVAVENGAAGYKFCDPTVKHLPAGVLPFGDLAREVLVVRDGHADWVRTPEERNAAIHITADLSLAADGELSGWFTLAARGSDAAYYADRYNAQERRDRIRSMQEIAESFVPGAEVADIDYAPLAGAVTDFQIRAFLRRAPRTETSDSVNFPFPTSWLPELKTIGERRRPYAAAPREETVEAKIALPPGWSPAQLPADFDAPSEAASFSASWKFADGALHARLAWSPARQELHPAEYPVFQRSIRALSAWLARPVTLQAGAPTIALAAATALDHFPILPTGEGQLRLLEEKFPEGGSNPDTRRAALERVLQWFPQDPEAVFNAQVLLVRLDHKKDAPKVQADKLAALIKRYGAKVTPSARAWAEYLEIQDRWADNKDKTCIERMRRMADDETLPPFRRGWAAYEAALFLGESNPSAAAKYLVPFCSLESESQLRTIALLANLRFLAADAMGLEKLWHEQVAKNGEQSDAQLNTIIGFIEEDWGKATPAMRESTLALLSKTFSKETSRPEAAKHFASLKTRVTTELAQKRFASTLGTWLKAHPPAWWTNKRDTKFADADALCAHIKARNDAKDATAVIDGTLQLALYHDAKFADLAQYLRWSLWWMNHGKRDEALFDKIVQLSFALPVEPTFEVANIWSTAAEHSAAKGDAAGARALYERILATPEVRDYQKVEAAGELGHLERKLGAIDAALAAYRRVEPIHTSHRTSADYLYAALLLEVERGNFDRGLELVALMAKQEQKYLDETANNAVINPLIRAGRNPAALKAYWQRTAEWRKSWNVFLATAGIQPPAAKDLPLGIDWAAENTRCVKAAADRDATAYFKLLADEATVAAVVPLVSGNFAMHVGQSSFLPGEKQRRLYECTLGLVGGLAPVDPVIDDTDKFWESALLSDLGRSAEAIAVSRALYERAGTTAIGQAGLRIWLLSSKTPEEQAAAADAAFTLLASGTDTPERELTVGTLSDLLITMKDAARNLALLERETTRTGFASNSQPGKALIERLGMLNKQDASAKRFTEQVQTWCAVPERSWLSQLVPTSLDDPRFANQHTPILDPVNGYTEAERCKFNLLLALDERMDSNSRESAFCSVVYEVAVGTNDYEEFASRIFVAARDLKLSPGARTFLLRMAIWQFVSGHRVDLLDKCIVHPLFGGIDLEYKQSVFAAKEALLLLAGDAPDRRHKAFALLTAKPIDFIRVRLATELLSTIALAGDTAGAEALLAGTENITTAASFTQSSASVRMFWTRELRHAIESKPFVDMLRQKLSTFPGADADCSTRARNLMDLSASAGLTIAERLALAGERVRRLDGLADHLADALQLVSTAQMRSHHDRALGADLVELLTRLPKADTIKPQLLFPSIALSDCDEPDLLARIQYCLSQMSTPAETASHPQTATLAMLIRATRALRTSVEERPDAIFDPVQTKLVPPQVLALMQLQFYASRGQTGRLESALETADPTLLAEYGLLGAVLPLLQGEDRAAERKLFEQAARTAFTRKLGESLYRPQQGAAGRAIFTMLECNIPGLDVPPSWFDLIEASTRDEVGLAQIRLWRARTHHDWSAMKQAAADILQLVPTMYDIYCDRARAEAELGQTDAARADYDIFLKYSRDSIHYQEALQARRALEPVATSATR